MLNDGSGMVEGLPFERAPIAIASLSTLPNPAHHRAMRRHAGWFLAAALTGCAAPTVSSPVMVEPAPIVSAPVSMPATLQVDPRNLGHLPASPAARAVIDPARLSELAASLAGRYLPHETALVEQLLALPAGALSGGEVAGSIGVDRSRSIQVALASLDPAGRQVVDAARSNLPAGQQYTPVPGLSRVVQKSFSAARPAPIHIRVVIPAADSPRLVASLRGLIEQRRYARVPAPEGLESLFHRRERAVALSLGPQVVVVDILVFEGVVPGPRMVAEAAARTWQSLLTPTGQPQLPSNGRVIRWTWSPAAVSELGLLETLSREQDRMSIERYQDPDAGMTFTAIGGSFLFPFSGAEPLRFREVELALEVDHGRPRIHTVTQLAADLATKAGVSCAPSTSVEFPGALARFDVSTACMRVLDVPGDTVRNGFLVRSDFTGEIHRLDWLRRTDWVGWPLAVPWIPFALSRIPLEWNAGVGPRAMQRMERFGWSNPSFGAPDVFWGLLPAGVSPQDAACAAEESGAGCKGNKRIKAGGTAQDVGGRFVRLVQLGNRHVLLSSRDRKAVEAMAPVLTSAPVSAMRGGISEPGTHRVMSQLGMQPEAVRYQADMVVEGSSLVVNAGPAK